MMRGGKFMFSRANIGDDVILRLVITNPKVTEQSLNELVDGIITVGHEIINEVAAD
jgi:hypothetical protein